MAYRKIFDAKGKPREAWLEVRRAGLGGSDMAAVLGMNQWRSPLDVWLDKTGRTRDENEDNQFTYWGTRLEALVADEFALRTGFKVRNNNFTLQSVEHPFLLANIDREIVGVDAGLECKTASTYKAKEWDGDNVPDAYYIQCQHYMAVTGKASWWIACLIGGNDFRYKEIPRNDEVIDVIIKQGQAFWKLVTQDTMPDVDGSKACTEALQDMIGQATSDETIELADTAKIYIKQYKQFEAEEKEAKLKKDEAKNALCQMLDVNERGQCDTWTVTWRNQEGRTSFDYKALLKEHGDELPYLSNYIKTGKPTRRFTIKGE